MRRSRVWLHRLPRLGLRLSCALSLALVIALGGTLLTGCATPKEIRNKKVLKTKWVDGKVVYVLESEADAIERGVEESRAASQDVVLEPKK